MSLTLLVLADPKAGWLKALDGLEGVERIVTNDPEQVKAAAPKADILLNGSGTPALLADATRHASRSTWTHSLWAGLDNVLSPEVMASTTPLTNGKGVFRTSLAEWSIGAMLHFSYRMRRMIQQQEARTWEVFTTEELHGRTLGVVGYGEIGRAAAERARAFGMKILALRRRPDPGDPIVDLATIMSESDYVLVAAPLTPDTRGMIGAAEIARMKPTAVLINVGRGAVVDEEALAAALEAGRIKGAALDVFAQEPLPGDHAFWRLPNVLLSPHTADHVEDFVVLAVDCFLENLRRFRAGEPLLNMVDKHAGY